MHHVFSLLEALCSVLKTAPFPRGGLSVRPETKPDGHRASQEQKREYADLWGRSTVQRAGVATERKAFSAGDARGSSQVSFDLYLVGTVFFYFSWNGMCLHGAKSILKSFLKKREKVFLVKFTGNQIFAEHRKCVPQR